MTKRIFLLLLLLLSAGLARADEIALKIVTLDAFMGGRIKGGTDVPLLVPEAYKPAALTKASPVHSYWMRPEDVESANATGDLPAVGGYMYGRLTASVAYDEKKDLFVGLEDPESMAKAKAQLHSLVVERYRYGKYPIVLLSAASEDGTKTVFALYVATNIDSNVAYIALRPPGSSRQVGEELWRRMKASFEKQR